MNDITDTEILRFYICLTERQQQVAQRVARGHSNAEVARQLNISPAVVAGHLTTIYRRLHDALKLQEYPNRVVLAHYLTRLFAEYPELPEDSD